MLPIKFQIKPRKYYWYLLLQKLYQAVQLLLWEFATLNKNSSSCWSIYLKREMCRTDFDRMWLALRVEMTPSEIRCCFLRCLA